MPQAQRLTPGDADLATLQAIIGDLEGIFGPLLAITTAPPVAPASNATMNKLTFDVADSPAKTAVLQVYEGHPPEVAGQTLICFGNAIVSSAPAMVAVYRPD